MAVHDSTVLLLHCSLFVAVDVCILSFCDPTHRGASTIHMWYTAIALQSKVYPHAATLTNCFELPSSYTEAMTSSSSLYPMEAVDMTAGGQYTSNNKCPDHPRLCMVIVSCRHGYALPGACRATCAHALTSLYCAVQGFGQLSARLPSCTVSWHLFGRMALQITPAAISCWRCKLCVLQSQ